MRKKNENNWQPYADMSFALLLVFMMIVGVLSIQLTLKTKEAEDSIRRAAAAESEAEEREADALAAGDAYIALEDDMRKLQGKVEKIVGFKAEILQSLRESFSDQSIRIDIDDKTGAIIFSEDIFFQTSKYDLLDGGKKLLDQVIPVYLDVLLSEEYIDQIAEITIEGNCDSRGTYEDNMELSNNRAMSVALYSTELVRTTMTKAQYRQFRSLLSMSGRADQNLIYDANGVEDKDASRRVEIKFRLKDEETINEIRKILEGV